MPSNLEFANQAPGAEGFNPNHPAAAHCRIVDQATGEIDLMGRKKIAICGFASSTRHYMPFDDPTWLISGLNQTYRHFPRADVHFDIHSYWKEDNVPGTDHEGWVRDCGIPVYMADLYPEAPTGVRYPVERLIKKFELDYFTSTVAFELAWAIDCFDREVEKQLSATVGNEASVLAHGTDFCAMQAYTKSLYEQYAIGIYGIDLIVGTEYDWQKACVEFYIGQGCARGINFHIPPESALLKQMYRYGYEREPGTGLLKLSELSKRHAEIEEIKQKLFVQMHQLNGKLETLAEVKAKMNGQAPEYIDEQIAKFQPILNQTVAELQTYDGAQQECAHTRTVLELRARGGQIPLGQVH
jgi:hypothetical protein